MDLERDIIEHGAIAEFSDEMVYLDDGSVRGMMKMTNDE